MVWRGYQMSLMVAHLDLQLELGRIDSFLGLLGYVASSAVSSTHLAASVPILTFTMDGGVPIISPERHEKWAKDLQSLSGRGKK
ncbi:hypothetical protein D8674_008526 [Pyrus ussuriensis x Pyrus communis]|uniref:Uncharacterized protein n=1 Tax=Pyrus ussuriensis x Pyrus communis TaxID=2448454 RepID=A0A5N5HVX4_9ROSA|nr:hypothetical protein D8674_008526 [Pyrus ussuriensis x Pyrus communis]